MEFGVLCQQGGHILAIDTRQFNPQGEFGMLSHRVQRYGVRPNKYVSQTASEH